jgi:hypothetical protein
VVFSGTLVSSTNKTDHRDITEVVLNMSLKDHNAKPLGAQTHVVLVIGLYELLGNATT